MMKLHRKLSRLLDMLVPECCAVCREPIEAERRSALCLRCQCEWEREKSLCRQFSGGRAARFTAYTDSNDGALRLPTLHSVFYYPSKPESAPNRVIYKLKHNATVRLLELIADEFYGMLREGAPMLFDGRVDNGDILITWIPRRPEAVLNDGYDHMKRCAKTLSSRSGFEAKELLVRSRGSLEQKRLDSAARLENAKSSLSVAANVDISGKTVILIDDLITTGASMEAASALLYTSGARLVITAALASVGDELYV